MRRSGVVLIAITTGLLGVITLMLLFVSFQGAEAASELTVCTAGPPTCQYSTIQAAVDAASSSDTIKVAGGTYNSLNNNGGSWQVVYINKTITIRGGYTTSFADPPMPETNPTIIDAKGLGRGVYITGSVSPQLEYLDIRNGDATGLGGGALSYDGAGGGVYVITATVVIQYCDIYSNVASRTGYGAAGASISGRSISPLISTASTIILPASPAATRARAAASL